MATFKTCIFEHHRRTDGKYPVSIRVYWRGGTAYIRTEYYVTDKQIIRKTLTLEGGKVRKTIEVKDPYVLKQLGARIAYYETLKSEKLGYKIYEYTAAELARYFERQKDGIKGNGGIIDFVEFSRRHCEKLRADGREKTARSLMTPVNAMIDFYGRGKINIDEINGVFLRDFEAFLRTKRTIRPGGMLIPVSRLGWFILRTESLTGSTSI